MSEPSKTMRATIEVLSYAILFGVATLFFLGVYAVARLVF